MTLPVFESLVVGSYVYCFARSMWFRYYKQPEILNNITTNARTEQMIIQEQIEKKNPPIIIGPPYFPVARESSFVWKTKYVKFGDNEGFDWSDYQITDDLQQHAKPINTPSELLKYSNLGVSIALPARVIIPPTRMYVCHTEKIFGLNPNTILSHVRLNKTGGSFATAFLMTSILGVAWGCYYSYNLSSVFAGGYNFLYLVMHGESAPHNPLTPPTNFTGILKRMVM